jgi:hypothetical protein
MTLPADLSICVSPGPIDHHHLRTIGTSRSIRAIVRRFRSWIETRWFSPSLGIIATTRLRVVIAVLSIFSERTLTIALIDHVLQDMGVLFPIGVITDPITEVGLSSTQSFSNKLRGVWNMKMHGRTISVLVNFRKT